MWELEATPRQVVTGVATTITATFFDDGNPADPGIVTVGIVDDAGAVVLAPGTATATLGTTGVRTVALPAHPLPNLLFVTWDAPFAGVFTTALEVLGGMLFSLSEARSFGNAVNNVTALASTPAALIEETRARILDDFQAICGVAFVPRYTSYIRSGTGQLSMPLPHIRIQQVRSVEERELMSGTWFPYDSESMADIIIEPGGVIRRAWHGLFVWGYQNLRVRYVHGYAQPPLAIRRAALSVLHFLLVPSNLTERALQQSAEFGVIQLSIPDPTRHRPYGLPFVDTTLALHCERVPLGIG